MTELTIVLGNKCYSSWSLRGWLVLERCGVAFEEVVVPLREAGTAAAIRRLSPSGRVPALIVEGGGPGGGQRQVIWDSLSIAEFLAERHPAAGLWPADPAARAQARAVAAEMHAGFAALRSHLPMDLRGGLAGEAERLRGAPGVADDIARIVEIWEDCRSRYGAAAGGDFLFGGFTAADAAYLPVASRFATYGVVLGGAAAAYAEALLAWPPFQAWREAALAEPWRISFPELAEAPAAAPR